MKIHREIKWGQCAYGFYLASSDGRIKRRLPYRRRSRGGRSHHYVDARGIELRQRENRYGRMVVSVYVAGGVRLLRGVHSLVAEAFLGPRPDGMEVNHKDGDHKNNNITNLEYVTHAENCRHASRLGLVRGCSRPGSENPNARLTESDVRKMRKLRDAGVSVASLSRAFGVCTSSVDYITRRVSWRHVK